MIHDWMKTLSQHYDQIQEWYPQDKLMILFDVDGTIIDMQYLLYHALQTFDQLHGTHFFYRMTMEDVTVHESRLEVLLEEWEVPPKKQEEFQAWYADYRASPQIISRPLKGAIEVIRWFQMQPNVEVGFKTFRSRISKDAIFDQLNIFGEKWLIQVSKNLVYCSEKTSQIKSAQDEIEHFRDLGYRIVAVIDNEPEVLEEVSKIKGARDILTLHANTLFLSKPSRAQSASTQGKSYDLTELISEKDLPSNIQLVWHGINNEANLRQFLINPDICWGEVDVQTIGNDGLLIVNHDPLERAKLLDSTKKRMTLKLLIESFQQHGKSIKLDLKNGGKVLDLVLERIRSSDFQEHELWFNGNIEVLKEEGFRLISREHPHAILQCPIDFLYPLVCGMPKKAQAVLAILTSWGINRFSISWQKPGYLTLLQTLKEWGHEVNLYEIPDLEHFLQAVLLFPRSITSDFNFPKWHYYGKGAGATGIYSDYTMKTVQEKD